MRIFLFKTEQGWRGENRKYAFFTLFHRKYANLGAVYAAAAVIGNPNGKNYLQGENRWLTL